MKLVRFVPVLLALSALPGSAAETSETIRERFLARLNQERASAGVQPLRLAEPLNRVAQHNAEEIRDRNAEPPGADAMKEIRRQLAQAGYEAHGWSHNFAAGPGDAEVIVAWWKSWNESSFLTVTDPDYQELGIGITDFAGTPLYTFLLAWREDEYFARQTASLADLASTRAGMLSQVNAQRAAAGAAALALNQRLNEVAQRHAEDMLSRSYYDHQTPEGLMPRERVKQAGYEAFIVAENIARGPTSIEEAMSAWMQSQGHRHNLLHPAFTEIGVGCAVGKNGTGYTVLWVQEFGRPGPPPSGTR